MLKWLKEVPFGTDPFDEMRSKPTKGGHANQCSYDSSGIVMMGIPEGGTADFVSHGWSSGHALHDLLPWRRAKMLGRKSDYYLVRPEVIEK